MLLSVLIPSNRQDELLKFLNSATQWHTNVSDLVEFVIILDTGTYSQELVDLSSLKYIKLVFEEPGLTISEYLHTGYKASTGDYVLFCNDDVVVETDNWIHQLSNILDSKDTLYYLNDKLFEEKLSCFPIVSREILDKIGFFPCPYKRYKVDDTLFSIFSKRVYLKDIVFRHNNDHGKVGFAFPDGRIYEVEPIAAKYDNALWETVGQRWKRYEMKRIIDGNPTKVMIGVPTMEFARQAVFYDHFNVMDKMDGTAITFTHGQAPARNRNLIVDAAIENGYSHILFIDDDVIVPKDLLVRLLKHDADIVSGMYLQRNYPHRPFIFSNFDDRNYASYIEMDQQQGTIPIVAAGFGCLLVKTEVFRLLERPYIRMGELEADMWCDDIGFFSRLRGRNLKMIADLDARCGHMASVTIYPNYLNNTWISTYDTGGTGTASVPQLKGGALR